MNLFPIAFALILGIYSSPYLPVFTALTAGAVFIAMCLIRARRNFHALEYAALCFVFMLGLCLYHHGMKSDLDCMGEYVTARGVISELPYESYGRNRYVIFCRSLEYYGGASEPKTKLLVNSDAEFNCGDSVIVRGKLEELSDDPLSYGFDTKRGYASRGIRAKITAVEMLPSDTRYTYRSTAFYANLLKSRITKLIYRHYSGDTAAAMTAIITGNKNRFSDEYNEVLFRTSMRSMFYPAFAHIAFLVFLIGLFSYTVPKRRRDYALLLLLVLYALYSSSNFSSIKCSAVLFTILLSKRIIGSGSFLNAISLYTIVSLIIDPMLLFNASYVISSASALVIRHLTILFKAKGSVKRFFIRTSVLFFGTMPICAYFIGHVSIYTYLASVVSVPLSIAVFLLSPLFSLHCLSLNSENIGSVTNLFIQILLKLPVMIDKLPFSHISLPKPSASFLAAFYLGAAALWYFRRKRKTHFRITSALALGFAAVCLVTSLSRADKLRLDFIDVGQGDAALVHMPFSGNILIDGGGGTEYSSYNVGKHVFVPYLCSHGVSTVQAAFVSHYHRDHCEGIIEALKCLNIKNLFLPESLPESDLRAELESEARAHNTKIWYISSAMHVTMDDIDLYIYPPPEEVARSGVENDTSLLIELKYGSFSCLFTGDMTANGERHAVKSGTAGSADVLKVSHHGSPTSTCAEFAEAVHPRISLIGVGEDNTFGFPNENVLDRLKSSRIYRTDLHGTIHLYAGKDDSIFVETEK